MRIHPTGKFDNRAVRYEHIEARPLAAAMGAEVCGVAAATATNPQLDEIRRALYRHKMIYLRNQNLTHGDHEAFSLRNGPFAEDAYTQGTPGHRNVHPLIKEANDQSRISDPDPIRHREFGTIEESISPLALNTIGDWVQAHTH